MRRTLLSVLAIPLILGACSGKLPEPLQEQSTAVEKIEEKVFGFPSINKENMKYPASCENLSVVADLKNMTLRCDEDGDGNLDYALTYSIGNVKIIGNDGLGIYNLGKPMFYGKDKNGDGIFSIGDGEIYSVVYSEKPIEEKIEPEITLKTGLNREELLGAYHLNFKEEKQPVEGEYSLPYLQK